MVRPKWEEKAGKDGRQPAPQGGLSLGQHVGGQAAGPPGGSFFRAARGGGAGMVTAQTAPRACEAFPGGKGWRQIYIPAGLVLGMTMTVTRKEKSGKWASL